jgi:hypothetical protein
MLEREHKERGGTMSLESNDFDNFVRLLGLERLEGKKYGGKLGAGGQGTACVYEEASGEKVVAKLLIAPRNRDEIKRFTTEAQALLELAKSPQLGQTIVRGISEAKSINGLPIFYFLWKWFLEKC